MTTSLESLFGLLPMGQVTSKQASLVLGGVRTKQFLAPGRGLLTLVEKQVLLGFSTVGGTRHEL